MFEKAKQLYELQKQARALQKELRNTEIEARSPDGKITVVFNGEMHLKSISIDDSRLHDRKSLERDLEKTIAEAISRTQAYAAEKTKKIMGDLGLKIPGM